MNEKVESEVKKLHEINAKGTLKGIVNVSNDVYHAGPGISNSGLSLIGRSPLHYYDRYLSGRPQYKTEAMIKGTIIHDALLEPTIFKNKYVPKAQVSDADERTKKYKDAYANFILDNPGVEIVKDDFYNHVKELSDVVWTNKSFAEAVSNGKSEVSYYHKDEKTGVLCRCRADWVRDDYLITDIKTTDDARKDSFIRKIIDYRYHVQAAFYIDIIQKTMGLKEEPRWCFAVIERKPPFAMKFYFPPDEMIDDGRMLYKKDLATYAKCIETNNWPGYNSEPEYIDFPAWYKAKMSD